MRTAPPSPAAAPLAASPSPRVWALLAMACAAIDLQLHLFRNWVAFDEGALGLASHLVRLGQWPHADFSDPYSGGLALLGAGAQGLFGDDLVALRIPLGIATVLWVGLLVACFRRFASPAAAAGLALLAYAWGPPLYTAAMPSWYLLFLATALCWTLLRWDETREPRWWGAAGLVIGVALTFKINALFLLAGAGTVLLTDDRCRGGVIAHALALGGVALAAITVGSGWPFAWAATLVLPLLALGIAGVVHARRAPVGSPADPARLMRPLAWLSLGVACVVVPWALAYLLHGGLGELARGLFVLPFLRPTAAGMLPLPFRWSDLLPVLLLPVLLGVRWGPKWRVPVAIGTVALALYLVDAATLDPTPIVRGVWRVVRGWAVMIPLIIAVIRVRRGGAEMRPVMIVAWVAAWFALIQYPFAAPNYLAYTGGILLLAGAAAARSVASRPVGIALAISLGIWTVAVDHGQSLAELGFTVRRPQAPLVPLDVPHGGGLLVPVSNAAIMAEVVRVLDEWEARTILAGPDAPEIYYFSERPLLDRELFEFLAPEWSAEEFARRIRAHAPDVVVLNHWAPFSAVPLDSVRAALGTPILADTMIGPFELLRLRRPAEPRAILPR